MPVPVAVVEERQVTTWDEFSGRLEAVERVEVRSRFAGQVKSVHFTEGALVRAGDLLVTIAARGGVLFGHGEIQRLLEKKGSKKKGVRPGSVPHYSGVT